MRAYLLCLSVAAAVTYLLTPAVRRLAVRVHAMTPVRDRDVHAIPTPRLGGVAMLFGFAAARSSPRATAGPKRVRGNR